MTTQEQTKAKIESVVRNNCKHLRVGTVRLVNASELEGLADGLYPFSLGGKTYSVSITEGIGNIVRKT